jgi:hypothetical protein
MTKKEPYDPDKPFKSIFDRVEEDPILGSAHFDPSTLIKPKRTVKLTIDETISPEKREFIKPEVIPSSVKQNRDRRWSRVSTNRLSEFALAKQKQP